MSQLRLATGAGGTRAVRTDHCAMTSGMVAVAVHDNEFEELMPTRRTRVYEYTQQLVVLGTQ